MRAGGAYVQHRKSCGRRPGRGELEWACRAETTLEALQKRYRVGSATIKRWFAEYGLEAVWRARRKGWTWKRKPPAEMPGRQELLRHVWAGDVTEGHLARRYGVPLSTGKAWMAALGRVGELAPHHGEKGGCKKCGPRPLCETFLAAGLWSLCEAPSVGQVAEALRDGQGGLLNVILELRRKGEDDE